MSNYNEFIQGDEDKQLGIYDETAQRIQAAYLAFRQLYEVQHAIPKEPNYPAMPNADAKPESGSFWGIKQTGMVLGLIGSVIVSASHTIPVFLGLKTVSEINLLSFEFVVGLAIFVMIEMSVIVFAYSATESEGNTDTAHRVRSFTRGGMWFIVTIAILANVYYVLAANINIPNDGFFALSWELIRVGIFLLIGTSAPVIAFMTGDIIAIDVLKHRAKVKRDIQAWQEKLESDMNQWEGKVKSIRADYEQRQSEWSSNLHTAWNAQKAKWGASVNIQVSKPEIKQLETVNTVSDSLGQSDRSKTLNMKGALQYIQLHELELETVLQTVLDTNPNATQSERAMALAEKISGDARGYKTVIRAYKSLGKSL